MQIIISYLNLLGHSDADLIQRAWNHMNDSLRTNVFVCYRPETIACACIFLAARELAVRGSHCYSTAFVFELLWQFTHASTLRATCTR